MGTLLVGDRVAWLVLGAVISQVVTAVIKIPRQVREARVIGIRSAMDWQMDREFLLREMLSELAGLKALGFAHHFDAERERIVDRFSDRADAKRLAHVRRGEDAQRALGPAARVWWTISNLWSEAVLDREQSLDWEARDVRWYFDELARANVLLGTTGRDAKGECLMRRELGP